MPTSTSTKVLSRPFLKWAGGKTQLIEQYKPYFPKTYTNYYEPFLGGGAVFFSLQPKQAFLSDINGELINTYRCVRDEVEALIILLQEHQLKHNKDYYYEMRAGGGDSKLERAARFIYLNKTCFNGLYRENSKGHFNVPMGKYKNPTICNAELLRLVSTTLNNSRAKIKKGTFKEVINYAKNSDDFVYFDPPYYPISATSNFTAYSRTDFNEDDQIQLRNTFAELASRGVKVMLSNSDCPFVRDIYQGFNIHTIKAFRSINADVNKRGKITEVLVTSNY
ncbi:MAG TPA: DNA adenine methylase [Halomicronema sp.]